MNLLERFRGRRERNAHKRAERAKELRERQRTEDPENVADAVNGYGFRRWDEMASSADSPERKQRRG